MYVIMMIFLLFRGLYGQDWKADQYDALAHNQFYFAVEEMKLLKVTGGERVLDIGSGSGGLTSFLAEHFFNDGFVQGIDKSEDMISFARGSCSRSNIAFDQCCAERLPYHEAFDLALSFWTLHWVEHLENAFAGIYRTLKPGGRAMLCFMIERPTDFYAILEQHLYANRWMQFSKNYELPLHVRSIESVVKLAKQSNFLIEYVEVKNIDDAFNNLEDLKKIYQAIPLIDCIPHDLHDTFYEEITQIYIQKYGITPDQRIIDGSPVIKLILRKI
jgi:ubiquinone/menaquinone biosynthesis C-methylase UbiE